MLSSRQSGIKCFSKKMPVSKKILNYILISFLSNFVPNKTVAFDDRGPTWMIKYIRAKIQQHNNIYKNSHPKSSKTQEDQDQQSTI